MRILGSIPHPLLKITVFKMDNRISVKFENANYEQTFKFGLDDRYQTLEAVQQWADETLINEVLARMNDMHRSRLEAEQRAFPQAPPPEFEEIV
ncbi:MAG: hypothetical protein NZM43_09195 [Saprospiraceae bacterium]|nr:hypothetical protein [Saprospiraceae bacterium]MDW8484489.1 hypothetical protein [Saprospiraceae bacterium]